MDHEKLVQLVVNEVMRQLKLRPPELGQQAEASQYKALAIFTGGTIGFDESLAQLKRIQEDNVEITAVLSPAAEKIWGSARIQEELGAYINIVTAQSAYPGKLLREADLVIVPVLTQNTAAKLALTFSDTLATTLVLQALMLGKPVIAAANAADPSDGLRVKGNMGHASPGLLQALRGNLQKLASYGVQLVDVACLAEASKKITGRAAKAPETAGQGKKNFLDAAAIKTAALGGARSLRVAPGTIVTPLARDAAREYGLDLVQESS